MNLHGNNPASTSTHRQDANHAKSLAFASQGKAKDRDAEQALQGRNQGRVFFFTAERASRTGRVSGLLTETAVARRGASEPSFAYEAEVVDGSVKVVIGEVELWLAPRDSILLGEGLASLGRAAEAMGHE